MDPRLLIVTGLPATGKSSLARQLADRYRVPLLRKDQIKEPLLDVLGAATPQASRALSDASFAVLFALLRELWTAGTSLIIEGNFRPGEHEPHLRAALGIADDPIHAARIAQVLCTAPELVRIERLQARASDPARHPGHRDATLIGRASSNDAFLDLPGERWSWSSSEPPAPALFESLDRWWRAHSA